jgi:hypothetical protein
MSALGFRRGSEHSIAVRDISGVRLPSDGFYRVLHEWLFAFESEWQAMIGPGRAH